MTDGLHLKLEKLQAYFKELGSVAIAFSSGVDSTFMLAVASDILPKDKVLALTAASESFPKRELNAARQFCNDRGIKHIVFSSEELNIEGFKHNPKNRCYLCKRELFTKIKELAVRNNIEYVCEGSNTDDLGDYRPGLQAVAELGIKSPLREAELTKQDIRNLSKEMDLPTWNKPSFACLASRFVYGELISEEKLQMVDKAEQLLIDLGFSQVRVRIHGKIARIEILPEEFAKIIESEIRKKINTSFAEYGFSYTALDLKGYRTGSMNETILKDVK
ncbi:MAG: ATP-dependent sacrificial sulfur transferase LarE [Alphaproteobacteria bacterium]|nr:ATP-dependent sacrificial sulfur transferase LarE [Alphaproteobacteria bacterium]